MAMLIKVPCTRCTENTVSVPANAVGLANLAVCASCAKKIHTIDHGEIIEAQRLNRQHAIESAWAARTPAFFRDHDLIDDPETITRLTRGAASRAALIVYGQNSQRRSALMWRYAAILGSTVALRSPEVGGGEEANTLALSTTADFKLVDAIKKDYLNRRYKAILLDGISTSRFISEARRHEEYGNLARTMLSNNQIPIFTTSMWAPDNPNANPFGAEGNRDLMKWVGVDAAVAFSTLYDRAGRISITA
jgi:hypothetical protein